MLYSTAGFSVPRLPEIYRKPLSWGHLAITDETLVPKGVRYRGIPLYIILYCAGPLSCILGCNYYELGKHKLVSFGAIYSWQQASGGALAIFIII